jgi:hypothetical protein
VNFFDAVGQLLIRYSAFVRYWGWNGSTVGQYVSYLWTSRKPVTSSGEKYCTTCKLNCVPMKLIRLIKMLLKPVPLTARTKARNVFGRSNTGIMGSYPARGMDVCPRFSVFVLFCVGPIPRPRSPSNCLNRFISFRK